MRGLTIRNNIVLPVSPEASSLGKFGGDVSLSHYTGALEYSIPLVTIGDSRMKWDFAMRYDGTGNKPNEIHGQLEQGWSLMGTGGDHADGERISGSGCQLLQCQQEVESVADILF